MEETLVGLEVAKLLKENGFQEFCFYYYDKNGKINEPFLENGSSKDVEFKVTLTDLLENHNYIYNYYLTYSAPTLSLAQKWLREVHNIHIIIDFNPTKDNNWYYCVLNIATNTPNSSSETFVSYEEALEESIKQALLLINNKN